MYQLRPDHNAVIRRSDFGVDWNTPVGGRVNGGLGLAGSTLFVDTLAGDLLAINIQDGSVKWRAHADNMLMSTPVVEDGLVFVGSGSNGFLAGEGDSIYELPKGAIDSSWGRDEGDHELAFDVVSGKICWSFLTIGEDMPSPAIVGNALVFGNGDLHAYGVNMESGKQLWKRALSGVVTMSSATAAGKDVAISSCDLSSLNRSETRLFTAETGRLIWRSPYGDCDASPTIGAGMIFVSGIDLDPRVQSHSGRGTVVASDLSDGRVKWRFEASQEGFITEAGSGERAIAATFYDNSLLQPLPTSRELVALDAQTGRVKWRFASSAPIKMSPVVYHNRVYVGDTGGVLYVLDFVTGHVIETNLFRSGFSTSPPIVVGDTLVFVNDQILYARNLLGPRKSSYRYSM